MKRARVCHDYLPTDAALRQLRIHQQSNQAFKFTDYVIVCVQQLDYSRLAASDATFEDKRAYHAKLMGQKYTIVKKSN